MKLGIAYVEPMLRLNVADVLRQIAWYKTQGMVKPEVDGATFIDKRYVVPLAELGDHCQPASARRGSRP